MPHRQARQMVVGVLRNTDEANCYVLSVYYLLETHCLVQRLPQHRESYANTLLPVLFAWQKAVGHGDKAWPRVFDAAAEKNIV